VQVELGRGLERGHKAGEGEILGPAPFPRNRIHLAS
jgi:hypothetical protein